MSGQLTGSHDLLSYFNLIPIYNKVVKANRGVELDPTLSKYISDLPGRQDMEYDGYLLNLLRDPQAIETGPSIRPLDADTLRDAFSLKEGPIPGFDASVLGTDDTSVTPHPSGYAVERDQYGNAITDVDYNGERKHKKKKKKRKHDHEHEGDHKKKKKKRDKEKREDISFSDHHH